MGAGLCKAAALPLNLWTQRPCRSCMQRHRRSTSSRRSCTCSGSARSKHCEPTRHAAAGPLKDYKHAIMQRLCRSKAPTICQNLCCSKAEGRRQRLRRSKTQQICQNSCCSKAAGPPTNHKKCAARRKNSQTTQTSRLGQLTNLACRKLLMKDT